MNATYTWLASSSPPREGASTPATARSRATRMDMHLINPDLAAAAGQAQAMGGGGGGGEGRGGVPIQQGTPTRGLPQHELQLQLQYQHAQPTVGYQAQTLQPSHQPTQQQQQQQQQQHQYNQQQYHPHTPGYPPPPPPSSHHSASSTSSAAAAVVLPSPQAAAAAAAPPPPQGRLGHVLQTMQQTGFHTWGFVIYRGCAYGDEPAWQRFVRHMKQQVHDALSATPKLPGAGAAAARDVSGRQLAPYLEWTLMEAPWLEGASKDDVRRHFAAWAAARTPQRDGPGADGPFIESHVPRFMYCVYVDRRCLRTLAAFDDWLRIDRNGPMQYLACILVDKNCPPQGEGEAGLVAVDGCERYYTGWMYAHVGSLPELYNTLGHQRLISGPNNYARPPRIYPGHLYGASMPP